MPSREHAHVLYVDPIEAQQVQFMRKFPDLPVCCTDQIPFDLHSGTAAVVVDHGLMTQLAQKLRKEPAWFWLPTKHLVTTYSNEERTWADYGYRVYRLANGPMERAAVHSMLMSAIQQLSPDYETPAVRLARAASGAVAGLVQAREDLGGAISSLKLATGKLQTRRRSPRL